MSNWAAHIVRGYAYRGTKLGTFPDGIQRRALAGTDNVTDREIYREHDLALFEGGPFVRFLRLARLRGDEIREHWQRRALCLAMITWLPLLLLAGLDGQAFGDLVKVPFILDATPHVRFLIALPLFVLAEISVNERIRGALPQFTRRDLVPQLALPRFRSTIASAIRMRDSRLAELVMLLIVYAVAITQYRGGYFSLNDFSLDASHWHMLPEGRGDGPSLAGFWLLFVSLPLFQFILLRWYYRILIWASLLWQVSRLDLSLIPTHPDRVAGLGFLSQTVHGYLPLALGFGAMLSAAIANRILYAGAMLTDFMIEITLMVAFVFCLVLVPLLFFAPMLRAARFRGMSEYGMFAEGVVRTFDKRWLREETREDGDLLDVSEVSAMTDLDTTVAIIREMRDTPITREGVLWIAGAVLAPVMPLMLTVMPAEELLMKLVQMLV